MSDGMKKIVAGGVGCLIIAMAFTSCSETITNPATPGSRLLARDVLVRDTILTAVSDSTFLQRIPTDPLVDQNGVIQLPLQQNLVGKTGNYTAYTALRFFPPARDTINVLSAKLTLRLVTWRGDSSGTFSFTVHKINAGWVQHTITWDTVTASNFFEATPRGSYSGTIGPDTATITVNLDTAMVREWYGSNVLSYGMLLMPGSSCSIIRGIHAFDFDSVKFQPNLEVIARNVAGTVTDTTKFEIGVDAYAANVTPFTIANDRIYSQAGIAYRSRLSFDVSMLPAGSVINKAELLLERDPSATRVSRFSDGSLPGVHTITSTDSTMFESISALGSLKDGTANTYSFDVRRQVQLWVGGKNYGLLLRQPSFFENATLDLYAFHSTRSTNAALRPRIAITYTVFQ